MSAGKTHVIDHVARLEPSPGPMETMALAMVLDEGSSGDMLLFCLDDDQLGVLCGAQAVIGPALATVYCKTQVSPTLQISGSDTPGAQRDPEKGQWPPGLSEQAHMLFLPELSSSPFSCFPPLFLVFYSTLLFLSVRALLPLFFAILVKLLFLLFNHSLPFKFLKL